MTRYSRKAVVSISHVKTKDSLESLLPISNYDLLHIKGFEVPQTHTHKSIQGFIIKVDLKSEDKAEAFYKNYCNASIDLLKKYGVPSLE